MPKNNLKVSVIIPCRNEEKFIGQCIDSILSQDYPKNKIEILVIDGMSEDRTREIIKNYQKKYKFIRIISNERKITPVALNVGIKNAKGEFLMRMDAHSFLEKDYIKKCLEALKNYNADFVGGSWKILPRDNKITTKAVVFAMQSKFGAGNAYYKTGSENPKEADAVAFLCCKKEVFGKYGYFNENLERSQDIEFNKRVKKAGGKIILVPDAVCYYYARSGFFKFVKHNFKNGIWAILPFKFSRHVPVSFRHLMPLLFVSSLILTLFLSVFSKFFLYLFLSVVFWYILLSLYFSIKISAKERDFKYAFILPFVFASLHLSYGFGSLWGIIKLPFVK